MAKIKVGDEVIIHGKRGIVESLSADLSSNGEPVTATVTATGDFAGLWDCDREFDIDLFTLSENQVLANQYGVTASRIWQENQNFLQNEGYFENPRKVVVACDTFDEWLSMAFAGWLYQVTEPFQKGDLDYGL